MCPLRRRSSGRARRLRELSILEIAPDDSGDVPVLFELGQAIDDRALEGEIALPQAKYERIARQLGRGPLDGEVFARGDLPRQEPLGHAELEAALPQTVRQLRGVRRD